MAGCCSLSLMYKKTKAFLALERYEEIGSSVEDLDL